MALRVTPLSTILLPAGPAWQPTTVAGVGRRLGSIACARRLASPLSGGSVKSIRPVGHSEPADSYLAAQRRQSTPLHVRYSWQPSPLTTASQWCRCAQAWAVCMRSGIRVSMRGVESGRRLSCHTRVLFASANLLCCSANTWPPTCTITPPTLVSAARASPTKTSSQAHVSDAALDRPLDVSSALSASILTLSLPSCFARSAVRK